MDSFDHYQTADVTMKYEFASGAAIQADYSRHGGYGLCLEQSGYVYKTIDEQNEWISGFAFRFNDYPGGSKYFFALKDVGDPQIRIYMNADGTISIWRSDAAELEKSSLTIPTGTWVFVEVKVVIGNSGSWVVRVNEVTYLSGTGDTQASANAYANVIALYGQQAAGYANYFDDFYVCDGSGSMNNDFLGDIRVEAIFPDDNGDHSDFAGSDGDSTDNFELVDEKGNLIACTADHDELEFTDADHGLSNGSTIYLVKNPGGSIPAGLSYSTLYYIIERTDDTFKISTSYGGAAAYFVDDGSDFGYCRYPDADTYVESLTADDIDTYYFEDVAYEDAESGIAGVQLLTNVKKTAAGTKTLAPALVVDAEDFVGSNFSPSLGSYTYMRQVYEQTPDDTPSDWTPDIVNDSQFGFKVIV
jgi:hypothetical protein